jgi:hypothetical protein
MKIAQKLAQIIQEQNLSTTFMWGDGVMVDLGCAVGFEGHPLDVMDKVCRACRRSPEIFEHFKVHGLDSRGRERVVSAYKLK